MLSGRKVTGCSRRGFTLLEILLAVALSAMLLVAVNFFVLSMGELWGGGSEERLFDRHVRGVTRFVDTLVQQSVELSEETPRATAPKSLPTGFVPARRGEAPPRFAALSGAQSSVGRSEARRLSVRWVARAFERVPLARETVLVAAWLLRAQGGPPDQGGRGRLPKPVRDADPQHPPTGGGPGKLNSGGSGNGAESGSGVRFKFGTPAGYDGAQPMLMFEIDEAPGQCVWPQRPLPQIECALQVNGDEGLVLLWKSKLEEDYGSARPRKTQLSPFGRSISFDYYDSERKTWIHATQPQSDGNGGWVVPQRVRLQFAYRGLEREVSITLPEVPEGAPLR
jgi:prepilin-type N-terminal cleavage/methylation domain-containing protein